MEVIDIDLDNIPLNKNVNFGGGIELLMNDKKRASGSTKIDLEDLNALENELNDLSRTETKQLSGLSGLSGFFSTPSKEVAEPKEIKEIKEVKELKEETKTWDGFAKVGEEIPVRPASNLSDREKRRKKRMMLKKLEEWQSKGSIKGTHLDMDSNYDEVEDEYEGALEDKRKKDSIKLQGWWFTTVINTLEYGNAFLNPFDLDLDGWGEQVSEDLDSYEDIFAELHEKYKGGKMAPEVSLLLRIGFSAAVVNMSNKTLSSATPGFNDVMKQNPELMKMFTNAAVNTMSQNNSAFDFAKTMMKPAETVNTKFGPPPAPVETKTHVQVPRPGQMQFTQAPSNRPDLMFREKGVDLNTPYDLKRPEMKGPQNTDIDQLLSGLKSRAPEPEETSIGGNDSMISVSSLKTMDQMTMPKKTRKRKSDKNSMALDI